MSREPEGSLGNGVSLAKGKEFPGLGDVATVHERYREWQNQRVILLQLWKHPQVLKRRV